MHEVMLLLEIDWPLMIHSYSVIAWLPPEMLFHQQTNSNGIFYLKRNSFISTSCESVDFLFWNVSIIFHVTFLYKKSNKIRNIHSEVGFDNNIAYGEHQMNFNNVINVRIMYNGAVWSMKHSMLKWFKWKCCKGHDIIAIVSYPIFSLTQTFNL